MKLNKTNTWKILNQETLDLENGNFIEISLKQPPESEEILIGISKGWYNENKIKKYKSNILLNKNKKKDLINLLSKIDN